MSCVCVCVQHAVGSVAPPSVFLSTFMLHMQVKVPHLIFPPDCEGSSSFQYKQAALRLHLLRAGLQGWQQLKNVEQSVCPFFVSCPSFSDHLGAMSECSLKYVQH